MKEWSVRKRASGRFAKMISRLELAAIFEVYGRRCFITSLPGPLSLLRADPDREFTAANAVPVLAKISFSLPHLPDDALKRWRSMRTGTAAREVAAPIIGAAAEAIALGAARLLGEENEKEERENEVPSFSSIAAVSSSRQMAHDHFVVKGQPRHADADAEDLPPPPAMCGSNDFRAIASDGSEKDREYHHSIIADKTAIGANDEAPHSADAGLLVPPCGNDELTQISVSIAPASFDRAEMVKAGRERVRMLLASRKRKASLVAVIDVEKAGPRSSPHALHDRALAQ